MNKIKNMSYMFYNCSSLIVLDFSNNTNNVTNMIYMFSGCSSLEFINLLDINTKNVTDIVICFLIVYH